MYKDVELKLFQCFFDCLFVFFSDGYDVSVKNTKRSNIDTEIKVDKTCHSKSSVILSVFGVQGPSTSQIIVIKML